MSVDKKILEELKRYNEINNYLFEQELPPPPAGDAEIDLGIDVEGATPPPAGEIPPPSETPMTGVTTPPSPPVDVENDPDVEKVGDEKEKREELEITDLVNSQKSVEEKQDEYFENLFTHLTDLEGKLSAMDSIIDRLNNIETKIEKYRVKTPEEKLELRTLDSGPFNQKLSQFFEDKEEEMEMTGKNEYVLTHDEVESYSPNEIKRSFRDFGDEEMTPENDMSRFKKIY